MYICHNVKGITENKMKKHHLIIILLILSIPFVVIAQEEEYNEDKIINAPRKKVGVVLSGGEPKALLI